MNGGELGRLVSSRCPCLRKLFVLVTLADDCDVSIRSESLVSLFYYANTGKLEIHAPFLEKISVSLVAEAYIVAPNLKKVAWRDDPYDPSRHQLAVVNRHLQQLWIKQTSMLRMRLFDTVNELRLDLSISQVCPHSHSRARTWISTRGIADYEFSILLRQHFLEFFF